MKKIDDDDLVDVTGGASRAGGALQANDPAPPPADAVDKTVGDDVGGNKGID